MRSFNLGFPAHGGFFDLAQKENNLIQLEKQMSQPNFWQDRVKATQISQQAADLKQIIEDWQKIKKETQDLLEITQLDKEDQDVNLRQEIETKLNKLVQKFEQLEFFVLLSGEYDKYNAVMTLHAGAGGDDAQDWVAMLLRMYLRYTESQGWQTKIIDQSVGSQAGFKSVQIEIKGNYAYGWLKNEAGVHRLVRISPFDAEKMRHTSFALIEVLPEMDEIDEKEIQLQDKDLRIDTFLSSGPGGQGMQKNETAVRITHLPTKISASCQSERSQSQNKETAFKILKSKLYQYYQTQEDEEKRKLRGEFKSAEWGNQIRSYVLHPYQLVKDHRTNYETSDVEGVLGGDLDKIIESNLRKKND